MHAILEGSLLETDGLVRVEILPQNICGECHRASGMLLFAHAIKIGREADLSLDLLLAIAIVIVRDDRHHHATMIATTDFERIALVVKLVFVGPAHAVASLAI